MKYCVISPYSRAMRNGKINPKNYSYWAEVVDHIHKQGLAVKQVGTKGEPKIDGIGSCPEDEHLIDVSFVELEKLVRGAKKWLSIDNFFHHFCHTINVPGIVIFGFSDPKIFGHPENINILKDRKYLRPDQFGIWESIEYSKDVFVLPQEVIRHLGI